MKANGLSTTLALGGQPQTRQYKALFFLGKIEIGLPSAVAAASILARDAFVKGLAKLEKDFSMKFPKGASTAVDAAAKQFVTERGAGELAENFQAPFPHRPTRTRFARTAEDGVAEAVNGARHSVLAVVVNRMLPLQPAAGSGLPALPTAIFRNGARLLSGRSR